MNKRIVVVAVVVGFALMGGTPGVNANGDRQVKYVANNDEAWIFNVPVADVDARGDWSVKPTGSTFTVFVDDFGSLDGTSVAVSLASKRKTYFVGCLPVRQKLTLTDARPGELVSVNIGQFPLIWDSTTPKRCTSVATAGVATFGGVAAGPLIGS